jgi:hypothetical protein
MTVVDDWSVGAALVEGMSEVEPVLAGESAAGSPPLVQAVAARVAILTARSR